MDFQQRPLDIARFFRVHSKIGKQELNAKQDEEPEISDSLAQKVFYFVRRQWHLDLHGKQIGGPQNNDLPSAATWPWWNRLFLIIKKHLLCNEVASLAELRFIRKQNFVRISYNHHLLLSERRIRNFSLKTTRFPHDVDSTIPVREPAPKLNQPLGRLVCIRKLMYDFSTSSLTPCRCCHWKDLHPAKSPNLMWLTFLMQITRSLWLKMHRPIE